MALKSVLFKEFLEALPGDFASISLSTPIYSTLGIVGFLPSLPSFSPYFRLFLYCYHLSYKVCYEEED